MRLEVMAAPSNAVLFIMDANGEIPSSMDGDLVVTTNSSIAVGTLEASEGPTRIRVVDESMIEHEPLPPLEILTTTLEVPSGSLVVRDVLGRCYAEWPVHAPSVSIRLCVNHENEPDDILAIVG